ncbi:unnamed protein product [Porites lobata]|uniref:Reverse transcriptase n=1 Tax=Porites lobata TaxID=104759 RepID=A0ABN8Q3K3_9CNID|nr:unnamed protein product [Porites lobata]
MYKMHHPKSDVDRLYLPRTEGGRGFDDRKSSYSISRRSMKFSRELGVSAIPPAENEANTTYARRTVKAKAKHQGRQQLRSKWESKALHGKYPLRVIQADVDQDKTHRWLKAAGLKAETEGFIIAVQDQSLPMNPKCRLCGRFDDTIDHLVSGCPGLEDLQRVWC